MLRAKAGSDGIGGRLRKAARRAPGPCHKAPVFPINVWARPGRDNGPAPEKGPT